MPSYPIDIDDASPLWQWSSGWRADPQKDSLAPNYYAGTFHTTNVTGSTASLQFVGQAVTFYTAKRGNRVRKTSLEQASARMVKKHKGPVSGGGGRRSLQHDREHLD